MVCLSCLHHGLESCPMFMSVCCKGRDEVHDRARDVQIHYWAHGEMRKREMEDKKSERGRGDRMRKLTEGDGGS